MTHCRAKEEPIMCHFHPKNNFAREHVFCLQSARDLRISFRFDIYMMYVIKSENYFLGLRRTANRKRALLRNYFSGENGT